MLSRPLLLVAFLCTFVVKVSLAVECWRGDGPLPPHDDCQAVIDALTLAAHDPEKNLLKTWGFLLEDTRRTARLPKRYFISSNPMVPPRYRQENDCLVALDARLETPTAIDHFRLEDVAWAARRVFTTCFPHGKTGEEYPGYRLNPRERHHVWVRVIRRQDIAPIQQAARTTTVLRRGNNDTYRLSAG